MTDHEPNVQARALLDLGDQLRAERARRVKAEGERDRLQARVLVLAAKCDRQARTLRMSDEAEA